MKQMTLARGDFEQFGKTTKRAAFLAEMDQGLPWGELCAQIEPHDRKAAAAAARRWAWSACCASTPAALVQLERPGRRRSVVRIAVDAGIRRHRSGARAGA